MNTFRTLTFSFLMLASFILKAQEQELIKCLQFQIKLMPDNITWGVYVKPDASIAPSMRTSTGSGQVTVVAPLNFTYSKLINYGGTWVENARVNAPIEAKDKSYISFGFVMDEPRIILIPNEETLLFSFVAPSIVNDQIALFDNETDVFATPNSLNTNPGNDLGIIDFGNSGKLAYYNYSSNYMETPGKWQNTSLASRMDD